MDYSWILRKIWMTLLIIFVSIDQIGGKRGGISVGMGRGGSRGGGMRSGGIFGGSRSSGTNTGGWQQGRTNMGAPPPYSASNRNTIGSHGSSGSHGFNNNNRNTQHGFGGGGPAGAGRYTKGSGVGSFVRSNQFKNVIVGAAAGYLTYQAGKHLIRSAMAPMMWNNRPYYWGSNHYRGGPGQSMCRMPVDNNDPTLGNVYFQDNTRPREIVWGCGYNEYCCGYECCRGNGGSGYGGYGGYRNYGFGIGSFVILLLLIGCCFFLVKRSCDRQQYLPGRPV